MVFTILLLAGWFGPEPPQQVWAVQCDGYEYVYEAEARLGIIEEIKLCSEED